MATSQKPQPQLAKMVCESGCLAHFLLAVVWKGGIDARGLRLNHPGAMFGKPARRISLCVQLMHTFSQHNVDACVDAAGSINC